MIHGLFFVKPLAARHWRLRRASLLTGTSTFIVDAVAILGSFAPITMSGFFFAYSRPFVGAFLVADELEEERDVVVRHSSRCAPPGLLVVVDRLRINGV